MNTKIFPLFITVALAGSVLFNGFISNVKKPAHAQVKENSIINSISPVNTPGSSRDSKAGHEGITNTYPSIIYVDL